MHYERFKRTGDYGPAESMVQRIIVQPGDTFGRWTVLEGYVRPKRRILCRCACGTEKPVDVYTLINNETKSCGCGREKTPRPAGEPYIGSGDVYGRLTALEDAAYSSDMIRFQCECGTDTDKRAFQVKYGTTRSCGCLRADKWRKHGLSKHPLYSIWKNIIRRCENPADPAYKNYGAIGRGICEGYKGLPDGLLRFAADLGERPPGKTTDRLDNAGGYWCGRCADCTANGWPPNVAWRTPKEQSANRRTIRELTRERDALAAELQALKASLAEPGVPS